MYDENIVVLKKEAVETCILCVIDFSETSKDALKMALAIADSTKSRLTVLYPYRLNQPMNVPSIADWKKSIEADAKSSFNRMTKTLLNESQVAWEFKPEVGFVDDRIEAFTEKNSVRIVVVGAELARNSDGALIETLDRLKCPLLIVPKNLKQKQ